MDIIQLSGYEPLDIVSKIEFPVMKAVHVGEGKSADMIFNQFIEGGCSIAVLLDTLDPNARGGTGRRKIT